MAVPDCVSIRDLSGKYSLNKKLSDDPEAILSFLSVKHDQSRQERCFGMIKRHAAISESSTTTVHAPVPRAAAPAPTSPTTSKGLTMHLAHSDAAKILTTRTLIGNREVNVEERRLDFSTREAPDSPFGKGIRTRSQVVFIAGGQPEEYSRIDPSITPPLSEEELFLRNTVRWEDDKVVRVVTEGPDWVAEGAWGIAVVEGERRHVRLVVVTRRGNGIGIERRGSQGQGQGQGQEEGTWAGVPDEMMMEIDGGGGGGGGERRQARMVYDYIS